MVTPPMVRAAKFCSTQEAICCEVLAAAVAAHARTRRR